MDARLNAVVASNRLDETFRTKKVAIIQGQRIANDSIKTMEDYVSSYRISAL